MIGKKTELSTIELAYVLRISIRRVQMLAHEGLFIQVSPGKYNLFDCAQKYVRHSTRSKAV